jgi:hypothetical protein
MAVVCHASISGFEKKQSKDFYRRGAEAQSFLLRKAPQVLLTLLSISLRLRASAVQF